MKRFTNPLHQRIQTLESALLESESMCEEFEKIQEFQERAYKKSIQHTRLLASLMVFIMFVFLVIRLF